MFVLPLSVTQNVNSLPALLHISVNGDVTWHRNGCMRSFTPSEFLSAIKGKGKGKGKVVTLLN